MEDYRISHITFGEDLTPMTQAEVEGLCVADPNDTQTHCVCWWDESERCCFCKRSCPTE